MTEAGRNWEVGMRKTKGPLCIPNTMTLEVQRNERRHYPAFQPYQKWGFRRALVHLIRGRSTAKEERNASCQSRENIAPFIFPRVAFTWAILAVFSILSRCASSQSAACKVFKFGCELKRLCDTAQSPLSAALQTLTPKNDVYSGP